jgi:hypothetical protein
MLLVTAAPPPLAIATTSLAAGTAGLSYLQPLTATGGKAPYVWAATGLPAGLTLTGDGILAGTPTTKGTTAVAVEVKDGGGAKLTRTLSLAVPDSLPAPCLGGACSIVTPDGSTVALAASGVVSITRDATSGAVNQIVINTPPPAVSQILAVEPTPDAPSGLVARVDAVTDNGDGTTTLAVTLGTPADAYAAGIVKAVDPDTPAAITLTPAGTTSSGSAGPLVTGNQGKTSASLSSGATAGPNGLAASTLTCTGGVTSDLHGLTVDPALSPQMAAVWNHPVYGGGGLYLGTGGLERFQFDLDGIITANLGVSVSGASTCTLKLPKVVRVVPAGHLGAVILTVTPTLTLNVTGAIDLRTSVALTCGTEYRWLNGIETRASYCHAKSRPLQLNAAIGVDATLTGALDSTVTLDEIAGITGNITAAAHAGYHPTGSPVVQIDANATYNLGACLACFWKGAPAHVALVSGTIFNNVLYTSNTPPSTVAPGAISGRVTDSAGTHHGLAGVWVSASSTNAQSMGQFDTGALTAADGSYSVLSLIPGTDYQVCFIPNAGGSPIHATGGSSDALGYANPCYNNQMNRATPTPVTVTSGATTTGINAALVAAGAITGTITDAGGTHHGLANVTVRVFSLSTGSGNDVRSAANGSYTAIGLPAATDYDVCFDAASATGGSSDGPGYLNQCYDNQQGPGNTKTNVMVASGAIITGINASLAAATAP